MKRELRYTLRLLDHLKQVTLRYFEISTSYLREDVDSDGSECFRAYVRDIIVNRGSASDLTPEQKYLRDLGDVISPVLSAYRTKGRIYRLQPRTGQIAASAKLEECGQRLAMDAYHFKSRLSLFGKSAAAIINSSALRRGFQAEIGQIIRAFAHNNRRLLTYRNFVVHGPEGRLDEFADLRNWELAGIFLHSDLWLDYNNEFDEVRSLWCSIARKLVRSMEIAIANTQLLNENSIAATAFEFLIRKPISDGDGQSREVILPAEDGPRLVQ